MINRSLSFFLNNVRKLVLDVKYPLACLKSVTSFVSTNKKKGTRCLASLGLSGKFVQSFNKIVLYLVVGKLNKCFQHLN